VRKTRFLTISTFIIVALAVTGFYLYSLTPPAPSTPKTTPKKTLVIGSTEDVTANLDPGQGGIAKFTYNVFDALYRYKTGIYPNAEIVPCLATGDPIFSKDRLECTIPLRKGVKFHDGTPFNASAVKFTIDRNQKIKGLMSWMLDFVDRVEVVDDYTIKIICKYPYGPIKSVLSWSISCPLSPTAVQRMTLVEFQEKPVGTGPFKFVKWVKQDYVEFERNNDYWNKDQMPRVDRIIWKVYTDASTLKLALENGEVDAVWAGISSTDFPALMKNPDIQHQLYDEMYIHWLTINANLPDSPVRDVRVRRAIALCLDQDEMSSKIFQGLWPAYKDSVFIPPLMAKPSWLPWTGKVDIAKAKQLLKDAGYPDGVDLSLWYTPVYICREEADLAVLIKEQLAKAGIRVTLKALEKTTFYAEYRKGILELVLSHMAPDIYDPSGVAMFVAHSKGSFAVRVRLNNTEIDRLAQEGASVLDPTQRREIYGELQDKLAEQMCYVPLLRKVDYVFYRKQITGIESYYGLLPAWWLIDKN
jgi:peptide/nickel transport system substrate-binding protein